MRKAISTLYCIFSVGYLFIRAAFMFSIQNLFLLIFVIAIVHHRFAPK